MKFNIQVIPLINFLKNMIINFIHLPIFKLIPLVNSKYLMEF